MRKGRSVFECFVRKEDSPNSAKFVMTRVPLWQDCMEDKSCWRFNDRADCIMIAADGIMIAADGSMAAAQRSLIVQHQTVSVVCVSIVHKERE